MTPRPAAWMPAVTAEGADAARAAAKAADLGQLIGPLPEWDLSDLYAGLDDPTFSTDITRAEEECRQFNESYAGRIADLAAGPDAPARLAEAIARYEQIQDLLGKLMSFAGLVYSGDTTDETRAKFYGDTQERLTNATSALLFFGLELNRIDDAVMDAAKAKAPLAHYAPWIEELRKAKPYQLEDRIEQLFLDKSVTANAAWDRLFDETIAGLRFTVGGEQLSLDPALNRLQDSDAAVRREAAGAISDVLRANLRVFTLITNTVAKDKEISDRWRGFRDVADARHLSNGVEPEVVAALVEAVQAAYPRLSHRYYKLKAKWFGKDALPYWDRNAPLPQVEQRTISWTEARDTVLTAYEAFSPDMAGIAKTFFDRNWIDAPTRPGKAPGAFAHSTVPSVHPYVLVNFQGKPRDVMTLAHELGHGVHQVLAGPNGALMAPTPLTLAETASVFGEMLTFRKLLAATQTTSQRRAMLAAKVEDMINTVVRQIAFYLFERKVHLARAKGELTTEQINALWLSVQTESLGPAITIDASYEPYWAYIPHFIHSPFYVYAYAFGDCLVNSLYGIYTKSESGFAERYMALLAAGGSKPYGQLLEPFGLDARDPGFWQVGLGMIEGMIIELEQMEGQGA